ncbi:hypothetical protein [Escherichia coli]|uniref:hypothetical protein n=1 Tax=Escherichia coli TaxID=562 RepID=UPI000AD072A1
MRWITWSANCLCDIHQRIIVIDVSENRDERLVLINPELLEKSGETGIEEAGGNPG